MDHHQQQSAKVERFLKLGYSHSDILRVLESLRHDAQTNDILEELIKTCHTRTHSSLRLPSSPKLVPRGCSPGPTKARAVPDRDASSEFRPVVIDGSNVAMSHGDKKVFSCQGLQLAVTWFWDKGLRDITVFVPLWRKEQPRPDTPMKDQHILHDLERRKILVYTPSRCVNGKRVVCYDDRYIIKLAVELDGIVVSNDNYRDLQTENPQWKKFIEERLLMYTFANNKFMPPDDPLGRNGPTIDDLLRKKPWSSDNKLQHCPYGKKCTYGVKCKFYHPERVNQSQLSVADELRAFGDQAKRLSPAAYQPEFRYPSPPPAPPGREESFRCQMDSLRSQANRSPQYYQSSDIDEAFGSVESSLSQLCLNANGPQTSFSSGMGSSESFPGPGLRLPHGTQGSYHHMLAPPAGPASCDCHTFRPCRWDCQRAHAPSSHQYREPVWGSCPMLPPYSGEQLPEKLFPQALQSRHTHSLPRDLWVHPAPSAADISEERNQLRQQMSTMYPQIVVEQVLDDYPHVTNMYELISLIQKNRMRDVHY